ncbi:MAG: tRNA (N(6)-L-threonylcarbamoyladenosine(37)-C(2))-methylthiotransferase MtaB [Tissierellia bacterium]|nr:tRNA (N(6)-L-threonylcarbamoyladenosine(37)-C(2))-methylthiotransferase MtaB [Tissierellia bacterium]
MEKIFTTLTLGCKVNQYETEAMSELFKKAGYRELRDEDPFADIYLINTCTVTNLSDRKSRQMMRRAKKDNPNSVVAVVGCYSQVSPQEVSNLEEVDIVLGTKDRNRIVEYCEEFMNQREQIVAVENIRTFREFEDIHIDTQEDMTRAYLKVQDGCNQFCTYCIIPFARGPVRSRTIEDAVNQARILAENGYQEIILTGIHIGSYGKDLQGVGLIDLIEEIAKIKEIKRIRLSSMEPHSIDDEFMERAVATKKLCDHFHLSLQNGSNRILNKMGRSYSKEEYLEKAKLIRKYMPDAGLTTDIIVGFPSETEEDFQETKKFVKEVGFSRIHVFKYSPRQGTKAAKMKDQIPGNIKKERSKELMELGENIAHSFIDSQKGKSLAVLFEKQEDDGSFQGYTTNYIRVKTFSEKDLKNQVKHVKIVGQGSEPVQALC